MCRENQTGFYNGWFYWGKKVGFFDGALFSLWQDSRETMSTKIWNAIVLKILADEKL